jgi:hypothetical protein
LGGKFEEAAGRVKLFDLNGLAAQTAELGGVFIAIICWGCSGVHNLLLVFQKRSGKRGFVTVD